MDTVFLKPSQSDNENPRLMRPSLRSVKLVVGARHVTPKGGEHEGSFVGLVVSARNNARHACGGTTVSASISSSITIQP